MAPDGNLGQHPRGTQAVTAPESVLPGLQQALAGRYVLERPLGRGGMGVVYLAREVRLDRRVAIKLLPPDKAAQPAARERFLHEARTAARLSHPNIVPIFAVHEVGAFVFFAMSYVHGETLGQRVRATGPLEYGEAARVLREVALALDHAHAHGIVHRDVKPDNILLDTATRRALVSDFGIARVGSGGGTTGPRLLGTAEFMSPEQVGGGPVDARSDIYSLGVVGFYMLSGELPFGGPDAMTVLARHATEPAPPLASVAPGVPRRLAAVIDRCLAKASGDRFPSGAALADAIAVALRERVTPAIAVRAFVTEARHLSTSALLYGALASLAVPVLAIHGAATPDRWTRVGDVAAGVLILALPAGVMLARVRRLLAAGYAREDLTDALGDDFERRREELAFLYGEGPSRLERVLRAVCYVCTGLAGGIVGALLRDPTLADLAVVPAGLGIAAATALLAGIAARGRTEHRTDPKGERRLRFWSGPVGRWLFSLAGLRLGGKPDA